MNAGLNSRGTLLTETAGSSGSVRSTAKLAASPVPFHTPTIHSIAGESS